MLVIRLTAPSLYPFFPSLASVMLVVLLGGCLTPAANGEESISSLSHSPLSEENNDLNMPPSQAQGKAEEASPQAPELERYSLRQGENLDYPPPFPNLTPIYIEKILDDGSVDSTLSFRAWDFNRDQRFDLLEVLDANSEVVQQLFDFDFDGKVDQQKSK